MRLLIASEAHFLLSPDGSVWTRGAEDYAFWSSYLGSFDEVAILARLRPVSAPPERAARADGAQVAFCELDDYRGPGQYLCRLRRLGGQARKALAGCDAVLLRAPGAVAYLASGANQRLRPPLPYAVEVLGDPWESLAPGRLSSPWRGLARRWSRAWLARLCREAPLCSYVTRARLEQRYPSRGLVFACSDVRLREAASESRIERRLARIREAAAGRRPWELGFLGSLETLSRAPDIHLRAVRACLDGGLDVRLSIAGDGRYRRPLERLAAHLDISNSVRFLGAIPGGRAVEEFLDQADLFLLASHTEGLPRALIEAMARACPAIGSRAGGIPELLRPEDLVEPGRADLLAGAIAAALRDPARLSAMARRNHAAAQAFLPERLEARRREFVDALGRFAAGAGPAPGPGPPERLLHVATSDRFWGFLDGQPGYMKARGLETGIASSPGPQLDAFARCQDAAAWPVAMTRGISPLADLKALARLWKLFRLWRPAIVHAHTPKAGLLAMLGARFARVPVKFYTIHGLAWQTRQGWRRCLLQALERLTCRLADRVFAVSPSVARSAIQAGCAADKIVVAGNGSANGLD
ncbi:MAG TPA: glycosyltransferase, partial [Bryobacterales bacterium]|nr:glycosyltransferase [Bryobacterales bacterium]